MKLILIRGLPGSGKSTLAKLFSLPLFEADQFYTNEAGYKFDPKRLPDAHLYCQKQTAYCLFKGESCVVSNTFSQMWEMEPYLKLAAEYYESQLLVFDLFDNGLTDEQLFARNEHGVPMESIAKMRLRWEKYQ